MVAWVVVGTDRNVVDDFSSQIVSLCSNENIQYCMRTKVSINPDITANCIAIAAGWRWLIEDAFKQLIVFHDSLLPKYRGFNPLVTALLNLDPVTGVTAILANKDFDRGDIIETKAIALHYPIQIADAINAISNLYFEIANMIFLRLVEGGKIQGIPQDETNASYSVWRDDEDYRINWSWSAEKILHFINCLSFPYKGASCQYDNACIRIHDAQVVPDVMIANRDFGKALFVIDGKPVIICGSGLLMILSATDDEGRDVLPFNRFRVRLK